MRPAKQPVYGQEQSSKKRLISPSPEVTQPRSHALVTSGSREHGRRKQSTTLEATKYLNQYTSSSKPSKTSQHTTNGMFSLSNVKQSIQTYTNAQHSITQATSTQNKVQPKHSSTRYSSQKHSDSKRNERASSAHNHPSSALSSGLKKNSVSTSRNKQKQIDYKTT